MNRRTRTGLGIMLAVGVIGLAAPGAVLKADVIFDNGPFDPELGAQSEDSSSGDFDTEVADDFLLSDQFPLWEIRDLHFVGRLFGISNPLDFRVRFYEDTGGTPSLTPFYDEVVTPTAAINIGPLGSGTGWEVSLDLPPVTVTPGSYFVSAQLLHGLGGGSGFWFWQGSQAQQGSETWVDSNGFGIPRWTRGSDLGLDPFDLNFSLTGAAVPEPGTALLLLTGLMVSLCRASRTMHAYQ